MDDYYSGLDMGAVNEADASIKLNESQLPFPAPVFFVVNGQVKYAQSPAKALYYGGWATDAVRFDQTLTQTNRKPLSLLQRTNEMVSGKGEVLDCYVTRQVVMALAQIRSCWITKDNRRLVDYEQDARRHVQALVILADKGPEGGLVPWGPAILSAKGFQAKKLLVSFDDWNRHTAAIRATNAAGMPGWMFYSMLGTFGKDRKQEMVGAAGKQSPITPIEIYKSDMTPEALRKAYGGEKLLTMIRDVQVQAKTWIEAWSTPGEVKAPRQVAGRSRYDEDKAPEGEWEPPF